MNKYSGKEKINQLSIQGLKDKIQEVLDFRFKQFQKGVESDIIKLLDENEHEKENHKVAVKDVKGEEIHSKQKQMWSDIDELFASPERKKDYILRGFKIIKEEKGKTVVACPICSYELNSRGSSFHWNSHKRKLEKLSLVKLTFEEGKLYVTCEKCSKKKKIDLFESLKKSTEISTLLLINHE